MSITCEQAEQHLASYALGALDGLSRIELEQHLAGCPVCRLQLEQDQQIVQQLPRAVNLIDPPPALKTRIMARIAALETAHTAQQTHPPRTAAVLPWPRLGRRVWLASLATAAVVAFLASWTIYQAARVDKALDQNAQLTAQMTGLEEEKEAIASDVEQQWNALAFVSSPEVEAVSLTSTAQLPNAKASLFVDRETLQMLMMGTGVLPPQEGMVYQLWVRRGNGTIISLGTFRSYRSGYVNWSFTSPYSLAAHESLSVTMEPRGGSTWPTSPVVLASADAR